ncbi:MAG: hypothetical protein KF878_19785 [Planctomycetes bacterium]|nr:hypothetical protein [Planctomycetota bacterium]
MRQRVLALVLPDLPVEVARRAAPRLCGRPLALVTTHLHGARRPARRPRAKGPARAGTLRLAAASREARAQGVRPGMTCAHALALLPDLVVREHRPEDDDAVLLGLAAGAAAALDKRSKILALAPGAAAALLPTPRARAGARRRGAGPRKARAGLVASFSSRCPGRHAAGRPGPGSRCWP